MASNVELLLDTSAAIPLVSGSDDEHERVRETVRDRTLGLAGHAAFETYSVLTRLPHGRALAADEALALIEAAFPATRHLSADGSVSLLRKLATRGVIGGSVYDAMVGAAAAESGLPLLTRDRRALRTYELVGAEVRLLA